MKNREPRAIGAAVILATGVGIQAFPAASEEDHAGFSRSHAMHGAQGMIRMRH